MYKLILNQKNWYKLLPVLGLFLLVGCGGDDEVVTTTTDPIASFQFEIDANDFLTVNFSNFSQNATSYAWDFGDSNTSTEESPSHTYAAAGDYTVELTATNASGTESLKTEMITITDPNSALTLLAGSSSKTWKLYREGISMSLGPDAANPTQYWGGLSNDGSRPCLYQQEITFHQDGTYEYDDKDMFWAEFGVFNNVAGCESNILAEQCFDPNTNPMVNACGDDVSAWRSGSHSYTYDPSTGSLTLTGDGAWIGIPKLATSGETLVPVSTITTNVTIEQNTGFDVLLIEFIYDGAYWPIRYASYSDASLEPALETETVEFGEDLPDASPSGLGHTFAAAGGFSIEPIESGSGINVGVTDPAGGADLVGEFIRTDAQFQELQFQTAPEKNDINFENLTTATIDVYFPSSNDYSGALTKNVIIGLADKSQTEQWWTDHQQYEIDGAAFAEDEWITISFDLNTPSFVANPDNGTTPYERNDYDMIFLNIGSSDHMDTGTFYVRNLSFQ